VNNYLGSSSTAQQLNYQQRPEPELQRGRPENVGKWSNNEATATC
jgi:hypothetical protein